MTADGRSSALVEAFDGTADDRSENEARSSFCACARDDAAAAAADIDSTHRRTKAQKADELIE